MKSWMYFELMGKGGFKMESVSQKVETVKLWG